MINWQNIRCYIISIFAILFVLLVNNNAFAIEKENIFPSQNSMKLELTRQAGVLVFSNAIPENDFSSQKSYIKLGGIVCVGKVISKINKSNTSYFSTTKYIKKF